MTKHWRYLKYVLRHKYYVLQECFSYGLIRQGITHDWTKFLPSEWLPYVEYFYGDGDSGQGDFDIAWNHHQKRNPHHWQYWQYWLLRNDNQGNLFSLNVLPMLLHLETEAWIENELGIESEPPQIDEEMAARELDIFLAETGDGYADEFDPRLRI